ncbi:MAG: acyl-CoA dehydrogenase family protein [Myxococcales bacterium]|nr:acyl-CoA dehydrogenase family protein [Myxococcales bacterium]
MTTEIERGRAALLAWDADKPKNFFTWDTNLSRVLSLRLGKERFGEERPRLEQAGEAVATRLRQLAVDTNHDANLPRLERFDGLGVRHEQVVFHPSYHEAGRLIWQTGVLSDYAKPGNETLQMALLYLFAEVGESGHLCPLACTAGMIKSIQELGTDAQKQKYLPGLLERDYDRRLHASQFLTEVQGGSDVGLNAVVARAEGGGYRLYGEKWFCSVIDAQLFLMTARPEGAPAGTRGLGLFIVPRNVDGETNRFNVRRLKQKLGTRAMASGEADFLGAWAEPVGPLDRGFKNVVSIVLNTSRLYNAVCCSGAITGAYREAASFAQHRRAFGEAIASFPLVSATLAELKAEALAALAGSLRIAAAADRMAGGQASDDEKLAWRVAVNVNKYWTAVRNTNCAQRAIEILGGNGTIETFSPLVQLYRDSMVLESWEGSHNVLVQQVLKDSARYGAHLAFGKELGEALKRLSLPAEDQPLIERAQQGLAALAHGFERISAGEGDQRYGRLLVDQAAALLQVTAMLEELAAFPDDAQKRAAIAVTEDRFVKRELAPPSPIRAALVEQPGL